MNIFATSFLILVFELTLSDGYHLCDNLPPGLNRLGLGVDISCLEYEPSDFTRPDGYRGKVIDFTCDKGKTWINPFNNITYRMPDQIWSLVSVPGGWLNSVCNVYQNSYEYKNSMAQSSGVSNYSPGMFSRTSSYKSISESLSSSSVEVVEASAFVSAIEATSVPAEILGLSEYAQKFVDDLPNNFTDESAELYYKFITYFGTHYFLKGSFGGYIRMWFQIDSSYYLSHSESEVLSESSSYFNGFLESGESYGSYNQRSYDNKNSNGNDNFSQRSRIRVAYHGGEVSFLNSGSLKDWEKSVPGNPGLFGGTLFPLYTMISDPVKQNSMKHAVIAHLDKCYLKELLDIIYSASLKYILVDTSKLEEMIGQGEELLESLITDHEKVIEFGENVYYHLVKPVWWIQTKLCFNPRAETPSLHCYEWGAPYCAHPYWYTSAYRDFSHSEEHSCQLSWGLFTPAYADDWFKKVELCFLFNSTGDESQCGDLGQSEHETCAPVNSYTEEYLDATSDLIGGCSMTWKLKVPLDAPYWFMNTELCLNFYGPETHCSGPGHENQLCAKPNEWTPDFHDDSKIENGTYYLTGCVLQWGIIENLD